MLAAALYRSFYSLGNVLNSRNDTSTGTTLALDGRFRAISSTDSDAATTLFKYNVYGQTTQVEDAKQNKISFEFDKVGQPWGHSLSLVSSKGRLATSLEDCFEKLNVIRLVLVEFGSLGLWLGMAGLVFQRCQ